MSKIDDPFEAEWDAANDPKSSGLEASRLTLTIFGSYNPWLKILSTAWNLFSNSEKQKRVMAMLSALHRQMARLGKDCDDLEKRLSNLGSSPEFQRAVYAALDESADRPDERKAEIFGTVLANSLIVIPNAESFEPYIGGELEGMIRDLAQLNDLDLTILNILREVFFSVVHVLPNLNDDNYFTEKFTEYRKSISDNNIHPDDFYAHCGRLVGFGLAMGVRHNPSRMSLADHMFRPTRRGVRLLKLLSEDPNK